jgi:hypothetical protein
MLAFCVLDTNQSKPGTMTYYTNNILPRPGPDLASFARRGAGFPWENLKPNIIII